MRRITKGAKPKTLSKNGINWTNRLVQEIQTKGSYKKVEKKYKDKYKHEKIKAALKEEAFGKCVYCERIVDGHYGRADHIQPVSKHPRRSFEWTNLVYTCEICNDKKSNHLGLLNPIRNHPENYVYFVGSIAFANGARGKKTEEKLLNFGDLPSARKRHLRYMENLLLAWSQRTGMSKADKDSLKQQIENADKKEEPFSLAVYYFLKSKGMRT